MLRFAAVIPVLMSLFAISQTPVSKPVLGRTSPDWAYLEYGLGQDRLGGAKIGYLDSNILVQVVDSTISNYRIQLSKNHFAYLDKTHFRRDTVTKLQPFYLTNSWIAIGDEKADYVTINLDERLPYRSMQQISPSRIVVDIFGATSNTNWITQRSSLKEIKNVYHEQIEDDVFRVTIELKHEQHWGHSIYYNNNRLVIKVKRQPADLDISSMKIAIDAGHGGSNTGDAGVATKIQEKTYTLLIAKEVQKALQEKNATVYMTREKDTSLGMNERMDMLKKEDPDFLISIHLNSSVRDSVKGVSTYYRHIGFRPLTQHILHRMLELGLAEFGNIGSFNFTLSGPTDYPNCLVEVAFLSNREDEKLIIDPYFHKDVAEKIVEGIKDWLKACKK